MGDLARRPLVIAGAVAGLVSGGAYALLGICIVLLYRMTGTLNIAQAAIGCFGTYVFLTLTSNGAPLAVALLAGVVAAALVGLLLGVVMARWFMDASTQTRATVTIAMLVGLLAIGFRVFGDAPRAVPDLFGVAAWTVLGVTIGSTSVAIIAFAVIIAVLVDALLQRTQIGYDMRALSEQPIAAELLGVPARLLTVGMWTLTGAISALALIMIAPTRSASFLALSLLAFPALAAALVGAFKSFPLTIAGGLTIGMLEGMTSQSETFAGYRNTISFFVVIAVLLWSARREVWDTAR